LPRLVPTTIGEMKDKKTIFLTGGPLYWLVHDERTHVEAYFGSREAWARIPADWDVFVLEQPARVPTQLDHGYDERKPASQWTLADLR